MVNPTHLAGIAVFERISGTMSPAAFALVLFELAARLPRFGGTFLVVGAFFTAADFFLVDFFPGALATKHLLEMVASIYGERKWTTRTLEI